MKKVKINSGTKPKVLVGNKKLKLKNTSI